MVEDIPKTENARKKRMYNIPLFLTSFFSPFSLQTSEILNSSPLATEQSPDSLGHHSELLTARLYWLPGYLVKLKSGCLQFACLIPHRPLWHGAGLELWSEGSSPWFTRFSTTLASQSMMELVRNL